MIQLHSNKQCLLPERHREMALQSTFLGNSQQSAKQHMVHENHEKSLESEFGVIIKLQTSNASPSEYLWVRRIQKSET